VRVSGQVILYQSERLATPVGAVNVCASVESPLVAVAAPAIAEDAPVWEVELTEVVPVLVQPARPFSKPPLVIPTGDGPRMVSWMVVVWVVVAPVPRIVRVEVPGAAVPGLRVNVELPPEVIDAGLRLAEAPDGTPDTPRLTVCGDPEIVAVLIVAAPVPFWAMVSELGLAEIEKSLAPIARLTMQSFATLLNCFCTV
jgi:hypothetical protein